MTRKWIALPLMIALALGLAACAGAPATPPSVTAASPTSTSAAAEPASATSGPANAPPAASATSAAAPLALPADLPRSDSQGSVEFVVTPLNLSQPGATLDFDVSMNTHSVNLAWDLAAQSELTTDTGREVKGQKWPVSGGHHVDGTLTFPSQTTDGTPLLAGAKKLTLTIQDAGAPERIFEWDFQP